MNFLLAFDKFKDSMTAPRACGAAAVGIEGTLEDNFQIDCAPLTDGGEGFCRILSEAADGYLEYHAVSGPLGEEVDAPLGWVESGSLPEAARARLGGVEGRIAVIEMATVAGLEQVPTAQRHPGHCTTRGVGELIRIAVAEEAAAILIGIGGSATSDLGVGALAALGLSFGADACVFPRNWSGVTEIQGCLELDFPPIFVACDVANPLLGPSGAAAVYGPQKGLRPVEIADFDAAAARMAARLCAYFEKEPESHTSPGCGAAGGLGFGLTLACGAQLIPGFDLVSAWLDLPRRIRWADYILTGEGCFDLSSLNGKGPHALLCAARAAEKPMLLLVGALGDGVRPILEKDCPLCQIHVISPTALPLETALARGPENLELCVRSALLQLQAP